MTMIYMYIAIAIIIATVLGIIFIIGLVRLIIGLVKKKNPGSTGKRLIVSGVVMMALPAVITLAFAVFLFGTRIFYMPFNKNKSLSESWQYSWVTENKAADEAITELLASSDDSDRERFMSCFTKELQDDPNFEKYIDDYFAAYPVGLSECELEGGLVSSSSSYDYGHGFKTGYTSYECGIDGEYYFITLGFCFANTDEPEKLGVTSFSVKDLEAQAVWNAEMVNYDENKPSPCAECSIISDSEVSARLIDGNGYLWTETENEKLSADEMKELLEKVVDLDDKLFVDTVGQPNAVFKAFNATGTDYYYELQPENGEPRYAYIVTATPYGRIINGYLCTPFETDYSYELCPFRKSPD